jgi:MFS family permease
MAVTDHEGGNARGSAGDGSTSTFAALAVAPYRTIWLGTALYHLAIFTAMIARGALAKDLGGTNTALGIVTVAFGATSLVFNPIGGVLADRFAKRRIIIASTMGLAVSSGWLGVTELFGVTEFWMLVVVSALQAVAFASLLPARMAYTAELVGPQLIPNAVALSQVSLNVNRVVGPAAAGVMLGVAWLGYRAVYLTAAALCLVAIGFFARLGPGDPDPERPKRAPMAELADGVRYAAGDQAIRPVVILAIAITMIGFPYVAFLPSVSEDFFGAGAAGFAQLSLVGALGGLAAGLAVARSSLAQGRTIQFWSAIGIGVSLMLLGWAPSFVLAGIISALLGAATAGFQSMNGTLALSAAQPAMHGRVQSLLGLGFSAFGLASLPLGILADAIGLRTTLVLMGVAVIAVTVVVQLRSSAPAPDDAPSPGSAPDDAQSTP